MAAVFSINIDAFPVNTDDKLQLGFVLKYMRKSTYQSQNLISASHDMPSFAKSNAQTVGLGSAIGIPFVFLAFRIEDLQQTASQVLRSTIRFFANTLLFWIWFLTLAVVIGVVPAIIWKSHLATNTKVVVTISMAVLISAFIITAWMLRRSLAWDKTSGSNSQASSGSNTSSN